MQNTAKKECSEVIAVRSYSWRFATVITTVYQIFDSPCNA